MDLTAVAALTAAAFSFVSVIIGAVLTFRLTSRGQVQQWRREQERPAVARILTLSGELMGSWADLFARKVDEAGASDDESRAAAARATTEQLIAGYELSHKLRYETAQLDLLAGAEVGKTAHELWLAHVEISNGMNDPAARRTAFLEGTKRVRELTGLLIDQARADLGLGPAAERR